jgi:hypothetical protein
VWGQYVQATTLRGEVGAPWAQQTAWHQKCRGRSLLAALGAIGKPTVNLIFGPCPCIRAEQDAGGKPSRFCQLRSVVQLLTMPRALRSLKRNRTGGIANLSHAGIESSDFSFFRLHKGKRVLASTYGNAKESDYQRASITTLSAGLMIVPITPASAFKARCFSWR